MATPAEFVALERKLIDQSRAVFDQELGRARRQRSRLTERGDAAMLILSSCGPLRREDLAIRQLAAARQNKDIDLYRRLLARFEHELGEPQDHLHRQAEWHIELAGVPEVTWQWSNMPELKAELVYDVLAGYGNGIPWLPRAYLRANTFFESITDPSFRKGVVNVPTVDDQPFPSRLTGVSAAGLRDFGAEGKEKLTSGILWKSGTKSGREGTWDQAQSA